MNKPLALLIAFLLSISYVSAQQKPGTLSITPKLGATLSGFNNNMPAQVRYVIYPILDSQTGLPVMDINNPPLIVGVELYDNSDKMGLTIGVEGQYQMTSALGLSFGAFYRGDHGLYLFCTDNDGFYRTDNGRSAIQCLDPCGDTSGCRDGDVV